ncbi:TATA element modulatory factor 1 TATA binding-domain-containing protein [Gigaspora rosea]|uniref:TATA element modulatory factor 1 TATA binding-domain-containing protein n=1 Tax=Gigaspora rosea TaxID=44941 RepID=A0A397VC57_9GLOM|nr:TATA element modulatory factor 1 TATA binding-domain-containing protein [Gigaspora rosea]
MSFFNTSGPSGSWGSMLKQAMNTVESKFDKALDIGESSVYQGEVYVDPVTGFVTTLDPPILSSQPVTKSTQNQGSQKPISTSGNSQGSDSKELRTILDNIIEQSKSSKNESETASLTSVHTNSIISNSSDTHSRELDGIDSSRTSHDSRTSAVEPQSTIDNFQHIIEQRERQLLNAAEQNALLNNTIEQLKIQIQELESKNSESKIVKDHVEEQTETIRELRATLIRVEEQAGLREDNFRHEILALQQQLQVAENYARDSTSEEWEIDRIQLLKQLEDVKTQYALSVKNWEKIEHNLTIRLTEMERERNRYIEECKKLNSQLKESKSHSEKKEFELIATQQKNSQLNEEIRSLKARIPILQSEIETLTSKLESSEERHQMSLKEAEEQYRCILQQTLEEKQDEWEERLRSEQEVKSKEPEQEKQPLKIDSIRSSPIRSASETQLSSLRSVSEIHLEKHVEGGILSPMLKSPTSSIRSDRSSIDGGASIMSNVVMTERLNSSIRYLKGQVSTLQAQLYLTTKNRDELADELVKLTTQMEDLSLKSEKVNELERQFYELNERYNTALELLGEKTEQVDELQADIEDMRDAYRSQITDLTAQLEKYRS